MSSAERATIIQQSPLLNLPGEIRNRIYYWVLLAPFNTLNLSATSEDKRINKLQYVCKDTHYEIQLLEFKINHVVEIVGEVGSTLAVKSPQQSSQTSETTTVLPFGQGAKK